MCDEKSKACPETCDDKEEAELKQINIKEVRNGFTIRCGYKNEFIATNVEELITLLRDALK